MNLRLLPQNKALFGSDPLAKFVIFVQKYVLTIWPLSSETDSTILKKELRKIGWDPELVMKMARGRCLNIVPQRLPQAPTIAANNDILCRAELAPASSAPSSLVPLSHACWQATVHLDRLWLPLKREEDRVGEISRKRNWEWERETGRWRETARGLPLSHWEMSMMKEKTICREYSKCRRKVISR